MSSALTASAWQEERNDQLSRLGSIDRPRRRRRSLTTIRRRVAGPHRRLYLDRLATDCDEEIGWRESENWRAELVDHARIDDDARDLDTLGERRRLRPWLLRRLLRPRAATARPAAHATAINRRVMPAQS